MRRRFLPAFLGLCLTLSAAAGRAQEVKPPPPPPEFDPATEPAVVAVAKVLPAVVNIATERIVRQQVQDPFDQFFNQFFDQPTNRRPRELQQKIQSLGSGFLIDARGSIVTNEHVVERAADLKIQVTFADGASYPAHYIAGDAKADLALIRLDAKDRAKPFPFINLNNASPSLLGETVLVLGNPLGYNSSVARGILSAKDREITIENTVYTHLVQTDAAINPGNSGGPLIDLAGRLVGVSSVKLAFTPQGTPTQGLGFAIPASTVAAKIAEFTEAETNPRRRRQAPPSRRRRLARRPAAFRLATANAHPGTGPGVRRQRGGGRARERRGARQPGGAGGFQAGDDHLQARHLRRRQPRADRSAAQGRGRRHVGRFRRRPGHPFPTHRRARRANRHRDAHRAPRVRHCPQITQISADCRRNKCRPLLPRLSLICGNLRNLRTSSLSGVEKNSTLAMLALSVSSPPR